MTYHRGDIITPPAVEKPHVQYEKVGVCETALESDLTITHLSNHRRHSARLLGENEPPPLYSNTRC